MATSLKNYITPNVGITGNTVYNPTTTNIQSTMIGLVLCNTSQYPVTANVTLASGANTVYIVKNMTIPVGNSLDIINSGKIILNQGNFVNVSSSLVSSLDVTVSAVEVV